MKVLVIMKLHMYFVLSEHLQSEMIYNFSRFCLYMCMYVCLSDDNFRRPLYRKFIFAHPVYLRAVWVKFVYEGHQINFKVTGAKNIQNTYFCNVNCDCP